MGRSLAAVILSLQNTPKWCRPLLLLSTAMLAACGSIDYDLEPKNLFVSSSKNKNIGVVRFHFTENGQQHEVRFRKMKGGYGFQTPIFEEADGSHLTFMLSGGRSKAFVGFQGKYNF